MLLCHYSTFSIPPFIVNNSIITYYNKKSNILAENVYENAHKTTALKIHSMDNKVKSYIQTLEIYLLYT